MSALKTATVATLALAIAMGIGRFAYTPLLPLMQDDRIIDIEQGGILASIHFVGYLLGALFAVILPFSPKSTLRFSLIIVAVSTIGMGLTSSIVLWSILRFLAGFTSALTLVIVSNYYVRQLAEMGQSEKQGWVFSGVGLGIVAAGLGTMLIMISGLGSATSWQVFGVLSLAVTTVICLSIGSEIPDERKTVAQVTAQKSPLLWSLVIPYGALGVGYIIPATYLPLMAKEVISSPMVFGWAWPIFGTAALISTLVAGTLQKAFSIRQIWVASQFVMALGLVLPVVFPHIASIVVAGVCVGGTFMVITMMGMKETHRLAPASDIMRHLAIMTAAFAIGQMLGPVLASSLYSITESFAVSLVLASAILVVTATALHLTDPKPAADHT
ncbi:MAG: YbfB/YjiJ family MFS transporter [Rhizobiaceae bacterium]